MEELENEFNLLIKKAEYLGLTGTLQKMFYSKLQETFCIQLNEDGFSPTIDFCPDLDNNDREHKINRLTF